MIYRLQFDVGFGPRLFGAVFREEDAASAASESLMHDLLTEMPEDFDPVDTPDVRVMHYESRYTWAPEIADGFDTHTIRVIAHQEPNRVWREVAIAPERLTWQTNRYIDYGYLVLGPESLGILMKRYPRSFTRKPGVSL